jgi:hypothetical protein
MSWLERPANSKPKELLPGNHSPGIFANFNSMINRFWLLLLPCLCTVDLTAQGIAASANSTSMVAKLEDLSSSLYYDVNTSNTKGSPFLYDKNATGILWVQKKVETKYNGFECRFDLLNNRMQVQFAGNWYIINDKINQAILKYLKGRDTVGLSLRSNYPSVGGNDTSSIYEVVEDGHAYQLLRYLRKTKADISMQGSNYQYEYRLFETWYLYNATSQKIESIDSGPLSSGIIPPKILDAYKSDHKMPRKTADWKKMVKWLNASVVSHP